MVFFRVSKALYPFAAVPSRVIVFASGSSLTVEKLMSLGAGGFTAETTSNTREFIFLESCCEVILLNWFWIVTTLFKSVIDDNLLPLSFMLPFCTASAAICPPNITASATTAATEALPTKNDTDTTRLRIDRARSKSLLTLGIRFISIMTNYSFGPIRQLLQTPMLSALAAADLLATLELSAMDLLLQTECQISSLHNCQVAE